MEQSLSSKCMFKPAPLLHDPLPVRLCSLLFVLSAFPLEDECGSLLIVQSLIYIFIASPYLSRIMALSYPLEAVHLPPLIEHVTLASSILSVRLPPINHSATLAEQPDTSAALRSEHAYSSVSFEHHDWLPSSSFGPRITDNSRPMNPESLLPDDHSAEDNWVRELSLQELQHRTYKFSSPRPPYEERNRKPKKNESTKVHAKNERGRRLKHKSYLIGQYRQCSDFALSKAGWRLDPTKPPMKKQILRARLIQGKMEERLNLLQYQRIIQLEQDNDELSREIVRRGRHP
jgi:hypothetical protein